MIEGLASDPGAEYAHVIELDAAEITPMVATPGDPGNGKYVRELNTPVPVEIAYGGTCTAGKNEDMDMYAAVLADALRQGKRVAESVKFYIQFGSQETRDYCVRKGYLDVFHKAGAMVIEPSCGACINAGPGATSSPDAGGHLARRTAISQAAAVRDRCTWPAPTPSPPARWRGTSWSTSHCEQLVSA